MMTKCQTKGAAHSESQNHRIIFRLFSSPQLYGAFLAPLSSLFCFVFIAQLNCFGSLTQHLSTLLPAKLLRQTDYVQPAKNKTTDKVSN